MTAGKCCHPKGHQLPPWRGNLALPGHELEAVSVSEKVLYQPELDSELSPLVWDSELSSSQKKDLSPLVWEKDLFPSHQEKVLSPES